MASNWSSEFGGYVGQAEKITEPSLIGGLLRQVQENHALLSISIPEHNGAFNSAILNVYRDRDFLVLDEIHPGEGHQLFLRQGRARAHARLKGVDINFAVALKESMVEDGIALYHVTIPEVVYYNQRRSHYRAYVGMDLDVPIHIEAQEKYLVAGNLHDISVGGIGAELKMASALELQQGIFIPRCDIVLPNFDGKISSSLEVRFFAKDKKSANIRIGGRFVDLDRSQQHIIERFVAYLDRRLRRKMIK